MALEIFTRTMIPAVEREMQQVVTRAGGLNTEALRQMLAYHMGWEGEGAGPEARGKRIRPLLVLLSNASAGGNWRHALPAAAAVELIHNFSLIHDDIEDNSPLRRGRVTVWAQWGIPQAINAGDAVLILAHLAILGLEESASPTITLQASRIIYETCLHLTQGQYLDIHYEGSTDLTIESYWPMVEGKTAALLAACTELGALIAETSTNRRIAYRKFGVQLGKAFQVFDDFLGIWGDAALTGKPSDSDLVSGKKSLPVLYGLAQGGPFAQRWAQGAIASPEVPALAAQLAKEGAKDYTQGEAARLTEQALQALQEADPQGEAGQALIELAHKLLNRTS